MDHKEKSSKRNRLLRRETEAQEQEGGEVGDGIPADGGSIHVQNALSFD